MPENDAALILAVDDDPTNLLLLSKILSKAGYRVAQANNGAECLDYVGTTIPDLILLDIRMPEMDGFEVCQRLKADDDTAGIPVMFLTAEGRSDENVTAGFGAGACDYITKPFGRADVLARIQLVLKQREVQESYKKLANKDPLTGLDNRRRLYERLVEMMSETHRHGRPLAVAMIDLDKFKRVNDAYGHDFGDHVLVEFARLMQIKSRLEDLPCRFGGEEFILVMPNTGFEEAVAVAERLRVSWSRTVFETPDGGRTSVTASFGIACALPDEGVVDGDDVIKRADEAMYAAKNSGRNRVVRADQMPPESTEPVSAAASEPGCPQPGRYESEVSRPASSATGPQEG